MNRRNAAERAIKTFKAHFIAGLTSHFPLNLWDRLVLQTQMTLNMMCASNINKKLSAYEQIYGTFDYNTTPLAPPGTKSIVHLKNNQRGTCAPK